jgi:23S rRNA (cytosine1962-C5)-methyltransferase
VLSTIDDRIRAAARARAELGAGLDCYRLFHGWSEGAPGLIIDRYGQAARIEHGPGFESALLDIGAILGELGVESVSARLRRFGVAPVAVTGAAPGRRVVAEDGLRFAVDLARAGNPGLFLDARPARRWLRESSRGRRVLNLFAFTGSLGIAAAAGGAASVTHVDSHAGSLAWTRENGALNGLGLDDRDLARMNIYQHLRRGQASRQRYDGIVVDPPPAAREPRRKDRTPGLRGVAALSPRLAAMLAPGGWLLCLFHRGGEAPRERDELEGEILAAAGVPLDIAWRGTSGPDFPEADETKKLRVTAFVRPG